MKNILISGAGVGGPALAYWLHRYNYNVTIVEKASAVRKGGYRIDIRGAAVTVVDQMGLLEAIRENATAMLGSSFVNRNGKRTINLDNPDLFGMREKQDVEIMRGDLVDILYRSTKEYTSYVFDESITGISHIVNGVEVTFQNGITKTYDLVVAADGLHSNVRRIAFGEENRFIQNLGASICIFTMQNKFEIERWELTYHAAGKIINVYSTHNSNEAKVFMMFNYGSENTGYKSVAQQKKIVEEQFINTGWKADVILEGMRIATDFYFDNIAQIHIDELFRSRVVLLGDAGYCPSPASGQGTSMALVGAYVLAGEIAAAGDNVREGLYSYQHLLKNYITLNQDLGIKILKEMVPKSKVQVWFQNRILRLIMVLPWREAIVRKMLEAVQKSVTEAANSIRLNSYNHTDK